MASKLDWSFKTSFRYCILNTLWQTDLNNKTTTKFYNRFPRLRRGWPPVPHDSFLHLTRSNSSSLLSPHSLISLSTTWLHVILGLPRPLAPSSDIHFLTQSSSFCSTCTTTTVLFNVLFSPGLRVGPRHHHVHVVWLFSTFHDLVLGYFESSGAPCHD